MLNRGVSGETTRQGLERFPGDVQQHRPDIVTLQFGLNDCNCWVTDGGLPRVSEAAYRANLIEMIERARHFGARRIILSTNHPTLRHKILLGGESLETRRQRYNGHVREVAVLTGAELCDIERAFADLDHDQLTEMLLPYPDQLHLTAAGHRLYGSCIQPYLERAVAAPRQHGRRAMSKSPTDLHWNARALSESDDAKVNIHDTVQRDLELDFVFAQLPPTGRVLEVGCGNGYVTHQLRERTGFVDAFDFAENMIARARAGYGEVNNRFFHGSVTEPATCTANAYDAAVCVRVLINLRDLREQVAAVDNIAGWLKPNGKLILVEGFRDGFEAAQPLAQRLRHAGYRPGPDQLLFAHGRVLAGD